MTKRGIGKSILWQAIVAVADMGLLALCTYGVFRTTDGHGEEEPFGMPIPTYALLLGLCFLVATLTYPSRAAERFTSFECISAQTLRRHLLHYLLVCAMGMAVFQSALAPLPLLTLSALFLLAALILHPLVHRLLCRIRIQQTSKDELILIGRTADWLPLLAELQKPAHGWHIKGFYSDIEEEDTEGIPCLGSPAEAISYLKQDVPLTDVWCAPERTTPDELECIGRLCCRKDLHLNLLQPRLDALQRGTETISLGEHYALCHTPSPLLHPATRLLKRASDILVAAVALLTVFPLVYAIVAILTKRNSPGPVLAKSLGYAPDGSAFTALRFRTVPLPEAPLPEEDIYEEESQDELPLEMETPTAPLCFAFGEWMERTGVCHFPLLLNLLVGDISLVGPRIRTEAESKAYTQALQLHEAYRYTKPGLTGPAQVRFAAGEEEIRADIHYMEHATFWLDLHTLLRVCRPGRRRPHKTE